MKPAYQTLREQLRDEIAAGNYRDGARLPTESELVARHRLSRQTVRRAFQDLVAEGVVFRVPGRGTYASERGRRYLRQLGSIEDLMSLSDDTTMEVLAGLRRRVDVDAASRLRLDDDVVYTVVFRRLHDGVPFVLTTVHLAPPVAQPLLASSALGERGGSTPTTSGPIAPSAPTP
jgi:GntR family transcriptional regulator